MRKSENSYANVIANRVLQLEYRFISCTPSRLHVTPLQLSRLYLQHGDRNRITPLLPLPHV